MDAESLQWLFSTIAQTLGAIVAFIGMLTVYKLDRISNTMGQIMNRIQDLVEKVMGYDEAYSAAPAKYLQVFKDEYLDKFLSEIKLDRPAWGKPLPSLTNIKITFSLVKPIKQRRQIKLWFYPFLLYNLIVTFFSIIALNYNGFIVAHVDNWCRFKIGTIFVLFISLALTLILCCVLVRWDKKPPNLSNEEKKVAAVDKRIKAFERLMNSRG